MKARIILSTALRALSRNVTRAALTALGIIIGVAAVITMMEIGNGSSNAIQQTIQSMGANNLLVLPGTAASGGVSFGAGTSLTLTPEDADAIARETRFVKAVAPIVRARVQIVVGNKNWVPLNIYGSTASYLAVRDWQTLDEGEMFTEREVRSSARVCVIGLTIKRELFGNESPIGREIRMQNVTLKVVGVLSKKGANMMGMDQDDSLIAPWTTLKYRVTRSTGGGSSSVSDAASSKLYPGGSVNLYPARSTSQAADSPAPVRFANVDQIILSAESQGAIKSVIADVTTLLRQRHHLKDGEPDDFTVRDMTEMTQALSSATSTMTRLLLAVAMISLLVGGVGIMNIMLVSVTERTREIGLRMAVGARTKDILRQFLVEAVVLCLLGGFLGIALGRACSHLFALLLHWPVQASIPAIIASFAVSAGVGVVFGYYPAWKASQLDPIEALRYE